MFMRRLRSTNYTFTRSSQHDSLILKR